MEDYEYEEDVLSPSTAAETSAYFTRVDVHLKETNAMEIGEHTSELQSHSDLVCRLLLEKKKKNKNKKKQTKNKKK